MLANRLASRDLRRAAWRLWITPFVTALSSSRQACRVSSEASAASPLEIAARALREIVLSREVQLEFRTRRLRERVISFFDDFRLANQVHLRKHDRIIAQHAPGEQEATVVPLPQGTLLSA